MTYITHITHIAYIHNSYYLRNSYVKVYFKAYTKYFLQIFFLYIKMTTNYYQKHKEKLRKEARERCQNLSEEEKDKKRKQIRERYQNFNKEEKEKKNSKNLSEEKKKKLAE